MVKSCVCPVCNKDLKYKSKLQTHLQSHVCKICREENIIDMKDHNKKVHFTCPVCKMEFRDMFNRDRHLVLIHKCDNCGEENILDMESHTKNCQTKTGEGNNNIQLDDDVITDVNIKTVELSGIKYYYCNMCNTYIKNWKKHINTRQHRNDGVLVYRKLNVTEDTGPLKHESSNIKDIFTIYKDIIYNFLKDEKSLKVQFELSVDIMKEHNENIHRPFVYNTKKNIL